MNDYTCQPPHIFNIISNDCQYHTVQIVWIFYVSYYHYYYFSIPHFQEDLSKLSPNFH